MREGRVGIADWIRELPIVDDLADLIDIISEFVPGEPSGSDYGELRDSMWWIVGADGLDTRDQMLVEHSLEPVTKDDEGKIVSGFWRDAHTGFESRNPSDFDIDHRVPFREIVADFPIIQELSQDEQLAIYNDPENLQVVHDMHNREKEAESASVHARSFVDAEAGADFVRQCADYLANLRRRFQ